MAKLSMAQRRALPKSDFAVPSKAPGPGSYPIPDKDHAMAAKGRAKEFGSSKTQKAVGKKAGKFFAKAQTTKVSKSK
jgi:hypothetical protein